MKLSKKNQRGHASRQAGFTFIELLIVVLVLTVLLAITLITLNINPARQSAQTNNEKRKSDVNAILNAVNQYMADNKGAVPSGITGSVQTIANTGANICAALVPQYIEGLPRDPLTANGVVVTDCTVAYNTNYTVVQGATNSKITVNAPAVELGKSVSVTR